MVNLALNLLSMMGGAMTGLAKLKIEQSHARQMALLKLTVKDRENSRQSTNHFFQWTRRLVTLSLVGALVGYPVLAAYHHWALNVPYIQFHGGIIGFFKGDQTVTWITFKYGLTFIPMLIPAILAVVGFYFGSGGTRS